MQQSQCTNHPMMLIQTEETNPLKTTPGLHLTCPENLNLGTVEDRKYKRTQLTQLTRAYLGEFYGFKPPK